MIIFYPNCKIFRLAWQLAISWSVQRVDSIEVACSERSGICAPRSMLGDWGVPIKWFPEKWMEMFAKCRHLRDSGTKCLRWDPEEEGLLTLSNLTVVLNGHGVYWHKHYLNVFFNHPKSNGILEFLWHQFGLHVYIIFNLT